MSSLINLDQLLRSIRVGPKALSSVLPDALASCDPMQHSARALLAVLVERCSAANEASSALESLFVHHIAELHTELRHAVEQPMNARQRLRLGKAVSHIVEEIDAGRELLDLLCEAAFGPAVRVCLSDLVVGALETADSMPAATGMVRVAIDPAEHEDEVAVNPRATAPLFAHAMSMVAGPERRDLHVRLLPGGSCIRIEQKAATSAARMLVLHHRLDCTEICLTIAARLLGARYVAASDGRVEIIWQG
jgi:hypothetical protein